MVSQGWPGSDAVVVVTACAAFCGECTARQLSNSQAQRCQGTWIRRHDLQDMEQHLTEDAICSQQHTYFQHQDFLLGVQLV